MATSPQRSFRRFSRREVISTSAGSVAVGALNPLALNAADARSKAPGVVGPAIFQATGVKIGEVTDTSALLWTRLTQSPEGLKDGVRVVGNKKQLLPPDVRVETLEGVCPGATKGRMRVRYGTDANLSDAKRTEWENINPEANSAQNFAISGLKPDTHYYFAVESDSLETNTAHLPLTGQFHTAPAVSSATPITFCVVTCLMYADLDDPAGFHMFPAIGKIDPRFVVFTGDNVYYDNEAPSAMNAAIARYHWERMYSLPRHVELLRNVATYWEKDDHDTLKDDCIPGTKLGDLTFEEGQKIYLQQCPVGEKCYRTFRWGKDLQIWLTEGRDYRSKKKGGDAPDKTIWGAEQKAWFKKTVAESDATWKILISPTPIVGPDRGNKNDNHANSGYQTEGDDIRAFIASQKNMFTVCGDRHWQYHSVHPKTGVREFSCGPASDKHASGSPGLDKEYHKFHRVKGGFLVVEIKPGEAGKTASVRVTHRDVHGDVVHEWSAPAQAV